MNVYAVIYMCIFIELEEDKKKSIIYNEGALAGLIEIFFESFCEIEGKLWKMFERPHEGHISNDPFGDSYFILYFFRLVIVSSCHHVNIRMQHPETLHAGC